jgi:hypothetical protein
MTLAFDLETLSSVFALSAVAVIIIGLFYARVIVGNQIAAREQFFELPVIKRLQEEGFSKIGHDAIHGKYSWSQLGCYGAGGFAENPFYTYLDTKFNESSISSEQFNSKYRAEKIMIDPNSKRNLRIRQRLVGTYLSYQRITTSFDRLIEVANEEKG